MSKSIEDYTINQLRQLCRSEGLKYVSKFNKSQLYAYCVENRSLDAVNAMRAPSKGKMEASPLTRKTRTVSPSLTWETCLLSKGDARDCVDRLIARYPGIFKEVCGVSSEPAALVIEKGKVTAIATHEGKIVAVEGKPPAPPPPPPPGYAPLIPQVKMTNVKGARAGLKKAIADAKEKGPTISTGALEVQIAAFQEKIRPLGRIEKDLLRQREARRKIEAAEEQKRRPLLTEIEGGVELRKVERCDPNEMWELGRCVSPPSGAASRRPTGRRVFPGEERSFLTQIEGGFKLRKVGECDYNMVWDARLGRCVAIEPGTEREATEKIEEILQKMEEEKEGSCIII